MPDEILIHVVVPTKVGEQLQQATPVVFEIDSVRSDAEQTSRFGLVEAMAIIGFVKSIQEVVKLALEIRKLLREANQPSAQISVPGAVSHIEIAASSSDSEVEQRVQSYFSGDIRASV